MRRFVTLFIAPCVLGSLLCQTVGAIDDPVAQWLEKLQHPDPSTRLAAASELSDLGADRLRAAATLIPAAKHDDPFVRRCAVVALGELGQPASQIVPALIDACRDRDQQVCRLALAALIKIGSPAIPDLLQALSRTSDEVAPLPNPPPTRKPGEPFIPQLGPESYPLFLSDYAAYALAKIDGPVRAALQDAARQQPADTKESYTEAVRAILRNRQDVADLMALLGSADALDQEKALLGLARSGQAAVPAIPAIENILGRGEKEAQVAAAGMLGQLGPAATKLLLQTLAAHADADVRAACAASLGAIAGTLSVAEGPASDARLLPIGGLTRALQDDAPQVRRAAITALIDVGDLPDHEQAALMLVLKTMLESGEGGIQKEAARQLARMASPDTAAWLLAGLTEPPAFPLGDGVADEFILALGSAGQGNPRVEEKLCEILLSRRGNLYSACYKSLAKIGTQACVAPLMAHFEFYAKKNDFFWRQSAHALAQVEPAGVAELMKAMEEAAKPPQVRLAALLTLVETDAGGQGVVEKLKLLTKAPQPFPRVMAALALVRRQQATNDAVPVLSAALADTDLQQQFMAGLKLTRAADGTRSEPFTWLNLMPVTESGLKLEILSTLVPIRIHEPNLAALVIPPVLALTSHEDAELRRRSVEVLRKFGATNEEVKTKLRQALDDKDRSVRAAAVDAMLECDQRQEWNGLVMQTALSDYIGESLEEFWSDLLFQLRGVLIHLRGFGGVSSASGELPDFPWPPPRYTHLGRFGDEFERELLGTDNSTLEEIHRRLSRALRSVDANFESSLFAAPGGFVMLAKLERIQADGSPAPGANRWVYGQAPLKLSDYLARLFFEQPAYFRVLAFAVTSQQNFGFSDKGLPQIAGGGKTLPRELANAKFKGRECYVLVYSFERRSGGKVNRYESLSAITHLDKSGVRAPGGRRFSEASR